MFLSGAFCGAAAALLIFAGQQSCIDAAFVSLVLAAMSAVVAVVHMKD